MPMTAEERRARKNEKAREYYQRIKERQAQYYQDNKEKRKAYTAQYYQDNKEMIKETYKERSYDYMNKYYHTESGKKSNRIGNWKHYGIICDDYNALYERYLNTNNCEECGIEIGHGKGMTCRCVDHDHKTGEVRNILCKGCNIRRRY